MLITEGIHRIPGMIVNQYLLVEPQGLTLIDTGIKGNGKKVLRYMARIGKKPERLKRILVTHADGDHYGALNELVAATGARVYAAPLEADAIRAGGSSRQLKMGGFIGLVFALISPLFKAAPSHVDELLEPGQVLPIYNGLQVLGTPGHTPAHLSFFEPVSKALFAGDSINIRGGKPVPSSGGNTWNPVKARQSFEAQMAMSPRYFCCGHGYAEQP